MKKIAKVVLCLASVALLGGCAKSVSAEEAEKIADGIKMEDAKIASGKMVTKYDKVEGSGDNAEKIISLLSLAGIKTGAEKSTDISSSELSTYFISSTGIAAIYAAYGDKVSFKADGNAISYSLKVTESVTKEDSAFGIAYESTLEGTANYNANGFAASEKSSEACKFGDSDSLTLVVSVSYSWVAA